MERGGELILVDLVDEALFNCGRLSSGDDAYFGDGAGNH